MNIVLNLVRKEYWLAEPHYDSTIENRVEKLKELYGVENILIYQTNIESLQTDLDNELYRGFQKSHYSSWMKIT